MALLKVDQKYITSDAFFYREPSPFFQLRLDWDFVIRINDNNLNNFELHQNGKIFHGSIYEKSRWVRFYYNDEGDELMIDKLDSLFVVGESENLMYMTMEG